MACNVVSGITYNCLNNTGGLLAIYITNFEGQTGVTFDSTNFITAVEMSGTYLYNEFKFNRDTSTLDEKASVSLPNGTTFYTQTVTLKIPRRDAAKRNKILALADGQPKLSIIVQDFNQEYWLVGFLNGAYLTGNDSPSGTKKGDENGYTLTFVAEEPELAYGIDPAVISAIILPASQE